MRPKAGLIVGKQTCGSFNLLYTTIRPIIGLASREYKHRMLATADTTAISASCIDLVLPGHHFIGVLSVSSPRFALETSNMMVRVCSTLQMCEAGNRRP